MMYKLYKTRDGRDAVMTVGVEPEKSFVCDASSPDYQEYCRWLAEGNKPIPADEGEQ